MTKAGAFLTGPIISGIAWIAYFMVIYGTPDPSAPYGAEPGSFAFVPDGLAGLLFDQRFGLVAYAPVLLAGFAGIGIMLARREYRRHALEWLFVAVPYLVVVTYVAMWWGGTSAGSLLRAPAAVAGDPYGRDVDRPLLADIPHRGGRGPGVHGVCDRSPGDGR